MLLCPPTAMMPLEVRPRRVDGDICYQAFPFARRPHISLGLPFSRACRHHVVSTFRAKRVYIIVSDSISKTSNFTAIQDSLGDCVVGVRYGVKQHVMWTEVLEVAQALRNTNADLIVTLGAGSLTDAAKVASLAVANGASTLDELERLRLLAKPTSLKACSIPIINIPTSLSGGEYYVGGSATDPRNKQKSTFLESSMGASVIILDPALTVSTPPHVWLSSGIRAIDHCVEGLCSIFFSPDSNGEVPSWRQSEIEAIFARGLHLLLPNLLTAAKNRDDLPARQDEMLGVVEAIRGLRTSTAALGASHGIGHQLGPLGVGHGETSCIMLPSVMKYNARHGEPWVQERQIKVLNVFWEEPKVAEMLVGAGLSRESSDAGDVIGAYVKALGMPRSLVEAGVGREKLPGLAETAMTERCIPTNPVKINQEQVLEILEMAYGA